MLTLSRKFNIDTAPPALLTPQEVADHYKCSIKSVYERKKDLKGFYPPGIKLLRFLPEVIYGYLQGQNYQDMAVQIRARKKELCREGVHYPARSRSRKGEASGRNKDSSADTNPDESDRHGI